MRLHCGSTGNFPAFQAREIGEAALTDHDLIPSLPSNRRPKTAVYSGISPASLNGKS